MRDEGKLKDLIPLPPYKTIPPPPGQNLQLMNRKACEKEINSQEEMYLIFTKEIDQPVDLPDEIKPLLHEYADVFPTELPPGLPPIRGIEQQIDLIPGAALPNRPAYRTNPVETKELQRQMEELMQRGHVRESLSPCAVPTILVPKKDGIWRMCVDSRSVKNITVKYRFLIPRIDDMFDELAGA